MCPRTTSASDLCSPRVEGGRGHCSEPNVRTSYQRATAAYYVWKSKYANLEVSQLRHLKDVEAELARLKRMYADLALEHHALKDILSRKL